MSVLLMFFNAHAVEIVKEVAQQGKEQTNRYSKMMLDWLAQEAFVTNRFNTKKRYSTKGFLEVFGALGLVEEYFMYAPPEELEKFERYNDQEKDNRISLLVLADGFGEKVAAWKKAICGEGEEEVVKDGEDDKEKGQGEREVGKGGDDSVEKATASG